MAFKAPEMPRDFAPDAVFFIVSAPFGVRNALLVILAHPTVAVLSDNLRGNAELVLAEVLNNIVEHAYDGNDGQIELRLRKACGRLYCDVFDQGAAMPNGHLPAGLAPPAHSNHDLAEGGFGWFLIRTLTEDLTYRRTDACNHLSFQLNIEQ